MLVLAVYCISQGVQCYTVLYVPYMLYLTARLFIYYTTLCYARLHYAMLCYTHTIPYRPCYAILIQHAWNLLYMSEYAIITI